MGKKCIPGIICIENMTLFLLFIIILLFVYIIFLMNKEQSQLKTTNIPNIVVIPPSNNLSEQDKFNNPLQPPLQTNSIPVNVRTQGEPREYQQVGILTRKNNSQNDLILPLFGRRIMNGRDKWQYYTITGTGNLNTRLPVSLSGKSCTSEYGCDNITNGDTVYVEGYNDTFSSTIYENNLLQYIPSV